MVTDFFSALTTVKTWCAAEELHEEGGRHWHVIVFMHRKLRSRNPGYFDLVGEDLRILHPNVVA